MITIFRKIRKNILSGNSLSRYLFYAVGEILLVVIGILIALQVNNWNVARLEKLEEIEILLGIKNDLENTIGEFEYLNQIRTKVETASKEITVLARKKAFDHPALDSLLGMTFYRPTFNNTLGSINLLFSSGKINLIQNDSIREFLLAWPGSIDDMKEEEIYATTLFQHHYYPLVAKYASINDIVEYALSTSYFGTKVSEAYAAELSLESDYQKLLTDKMFLNHVRMRATHMIISTAETQTLIRQARGIIAIIDKQVKDTKRY